MVNRYKMFFLVLVFILVSCGNSVSGDLPQTPEPLAYEGLNPQDRVFVQVQDLVEKIRQNPNSDPKIREYFGDCKFYKQETGSEAEYDLGDSSCLILVASEVSTDSTIAITNSTVSENGRVISYAIFYPYALSLESLERVVYHEAVHMVDFMENPVCNDTALACRVRDEFLAHSKTMPLFQDFLIGQGFTVEQIMEANLDSPNDPLIVFANEIAISQIDFDVIVNDMKLLQEFLKGDLFIYLYRYFS